MIIGLLTVELNIPGCGSIKEKRRVIKSLKERMRSRFNISVSEVDNHDKWQRASIAIANISTDKAHVNSILSNVLNFIERFDHAHIADHQIEIL